LRAVPNCWLDLETSVHGRPRILIRLRRRCTRLTSVVTTGESSERDPAESAGRLRKLLRDPFSFDSFRPHQEAVCQAATAGRDVLLVMPTGAGKSLCYQLPGLARRGTTLVISPLIALIEDQVAKLAGLGLAAERVHSGRDRLSSRAACRAYLDGRLDFLFIAPERLKVPGFPEMLARRPPTLVAIDEAHCISQWGHDFRPEYRMLGERLPLLRPAPFVALTATATPTVQNDIVTQLRLENVERHIHGFRRTNLFVESVEKGPSARREAVVALVSDPGNRPAIVYAPTRAETEELARDLARVVRVAPYHAGLAASARESAQAAFLAGSIDVIVATIAFGMGIDKPNIRMVVHTALPGSIEGYYQEIGRAGRDGQMSRAVLFQSFVDTKTHEFFHEKDYPDVSILDRIYRALAAEPIAKEDLAARLRVEAETFDKALEKLWLHGGARIEPDESIRRGEPDFAGSYRKQVEFRLEQIQKMRRYAEKNVCRMLQLVRHFGDEVDSGVACGQCDVCAPGHSVANEYRAPSGPEASAAVRVLAALAEKDGQTTGQLHRELFPEAEMDRRSFEHVVGGLARAGQIHLSDESFIKDGGSIPFQRAHLTTRGSRGVKPEFKIVQGASGSRRKGGRRKEREARRAELSPEARPLFDALRAWRLAEATKAHIPAFRILSDVSLCEIVGLMPANEEALLRVSGVGPGVARRYGGALLEIVSRYAR
jgi:DNA topoisomerase III